LSSLEALPEASFRPRKAARRSGPHSEKDVKIYGTNSTSPLASIKVSKNELKTNSKNVLKIRKKAKTNWKADPTGEE
jgi:hypothetical protein